VKIDTAARNGLPSSDDPPLLSCPVECQIHQPHAIVAAGRIINHSVRGKSNHLSRTVSLTIGVARLTSATPSATHKRPQRAQPIAFARTPPSVLRMSQVAPMST
jgi:hypothetical protein